MTAAVATCELLHGLRCRVIRVAFGSRILHFEPPKTLHLNLCLDAGGAHEFDTYECVDDEFGIAVFGRSTAETIAAYAAEVWHAWTGTDGPSNAMTRRLSESRETQLVERYDDGQER